MERPLGTGVTARPIRIDDVTAGLLDARLEVLADGQAFYLGGERTGGRCPANAAG